MQRYCFFVLLFCCILSLYGCVGLEYIGFSSGKSQESVISTPSIESENIPPPVSEDNLSNIQNISQPLKDDSASKMDMIGMWKMSHQNVNCDIILTLTRIKKNFRGTSRGCYGKLALLSAWNMVDGNLELKNVRGNNIIVLSRVDDQLFEGSFDGEDEKVSISR
ncbi:MAG: hypothetical protein C4617_05655 [Candidatus Liberibacter europaeus]|uniref:Alkaline proteinase inhibitor/ Outer membrane lipoprotein Omp19 domain-containing protein n=1 Tax=Candidatus Liberibacter europaeus TaxID=744859 RepID=A0A2T4VWB0_9HYPH|nr:hypothetical protein [Candidatus Liberibacter europaeus]PTL86040.1 MAG: hypothetical protein C4617_05655 [Candidatus Liberibacter europaeus]